jgi:hypothetical protein
VSVVQFVRRKCFTIDNGSGGCNPHYSGLPRTVISTYIA